VSGLEKGSNLLEGSRPRSLQMHRPPARFAQFFVWRQLLGNRHDMKQPRPRQTPSQVPMFLPLLNMSAESVPSHLQPCRHTQTERLVIAPSPCHNHNGTITIPSLVSHTLQGFTLEVPLCRVQFTVMAAMPRYATQFLL